MEDLGAGGRINIKMDVKSIGGEGGGLDWIDVAQYRDKEGVIVNAVMNLPSP